MRAVLIVNPNATSTTPAGRDLLAHALESRVDLTVVHTDHRGHAIEIGQQAAADGTDVVIVHGGDGTVNEVVNGILGHSNGTRANTAVGVVPGGSANVFARSLGISPDPLEATNQLVDLLDGASEAMGNMDGASRATGSATGASEATGNLAGASEATGNIGDDHRGVPWRRIGLMDCGERWAVFTAGLGVDGDVVAAVEAQRAKGKKVSAARYIRVAVREALASARKPPTLTLQLPDSEPVPGVHFAFVSNSSPWTYANARPVWTNPTTTFETGLGVFATTSMNVWANLKLARQMLSPTPHLRAAHLIREDDLPWLRVTSDTPAACQIDGDFIGLRQTMTFTAVPEALSVVAPPAKSR